MPKLDFYRQAAWQRAWVMRLPRAWRGFRIPSTRRVEVTKPGLHQMLPHAGHRSP